MRNIKVFAVAPILFLTLLTCPTWAVESYYGEEIAKQEHRLDQADLKALLFNVLSKAHIVRNGQPDELVNSCPANQRCLEHRSLGYDGARRKLFGRLFLLENKGEYALPDVYCNTVLTAKDFPRGQGPGPDKIPANAVVNAEHTWPQSRFSKRFPSGLQKSDLHILLATSARANSLRGNQPFGDVVASRKQVCPESTLGFTSRTNSNFFLPPANIRGDVARAVFYFAVRYQMPIDPEQEEATRRWNRQDPVDQPERERHQLKFEWTEVRNPFIDHPEWVDLIQDF
ncbi:MAG: endonuclease [Bdellovibrionales bacterium]